MNDVQCLIRQLRQQGWTVVAIADALEVSRETIQSWQRGEGPAMVHVVTFYLRELVKNDLIPA
jgi:uncharacterized protein YjcR